jgi:hypothetical protein
VTGGADRLGAPSGAAFSRCRRYRYALWRNWGNGGRRVLFVGLNPSTADARTDDPTMRRCRGFAKAWGFDGMLVGNLFAWRATRPRDLWRSADPVGPRNDRWLVRLAAAADLVVACWGNGGRRLDRDAAFAARHAALHCMQVNADGTPTHPLYLPAGLTPRPWRHPQAG